MPFGPRAASPALAHAIASRRVAHELIDWRAILIPDDYDGNSIGGYDPV
jgi:hypothetical protein